MTRWDCARCGSKGTTRDGWCIHCWREVSKEQEAEVERLREDKQQAQTDVGRACRMIIRLRARLRKVQLAARRHLVHFDRNYDTGEGAYHWWMNKSGGSLRCCPDCYRALPASGVCDAVECGGSGRSK